MKKISITVLFILAIVLVCGLFQAKSLNAFEPPRPQGNYISIYVKSPPIGYNAETGEYIF